MVEGPPLRELNMPQIALGEKYVNAIGSSCSLPASSGHCVRQSKTVGGSTRIGLLVATLRGPTFPGVVCSDRRPRPTSTSVATMATASSAATAGVSHAGRTPRDRPRDARSSRSRAAIVRESHKRCGKSGPGSNALARFRLSLSAIYLHLGERHCRPEPFQRPVDPLLDASR